MIMEDAKIPRQKNEKRKKQKKVKIGVRWHTYKGIGNESVHCTLCDNRWLVENRFLNPARASQSDWISMKL